MSSSIEDNQKYEMSPVFLSKYCIVILIVTVFMKMQIKKNIFDFHSSKATLQRKSHLCIPFLGIAQPQPQFPHSCVCERSLQQNRQTDPGNL
jgi:hypothetical protein